MEHSKYKAIKVDTVSGEVTLNYQPIPDMTGIEELICETRCSYSRVCPSLPDPRRNAPANSSFIQFCGSVGEGDDESMELKNAVPVKGSLEKAFKGVFDKDIYQLLIDDNPQVDVKTFISGVCSTTCDMYDPSYKNCKVSNLSCFLHDLFEISPVKSIPAPKEESDKEENKETEQPII